MRGAIRTGETLNFEEVVEKFGHLIPTGTETPQVAPIWLSDVRRSIPVRLIDTERLTGMAEPQRQARNRTTPSPRKDRRWPLLRSGLSCPPLSTSESETPQRYAHYLTASRMA